MSDEYTDTQPEQNADISAVIWSWYRASRGTQKAVRITVSVFLGFLFVLATSITGTLMEAIFNDDPFSGKFVELSKGIIVLFSWFIYPTWIVFRGGHKPSNDR